MTSSPFVPMIVCASAPVTASASVRPATASMAVTSLLILISILLQSGSLHPLEPRGSARTMNFLLRTAPGLLAGLLDGSSAVTLL